MKEEIPPHPLLSFLSGARYAPARVSAQHGFWHTYAHEHVCCQSCKFNDTVRCFTNYLLNGCVERWCALGLIYLPLMPRQLIGGMSALTLFKSNKPQVCTCYLSVFFLNIFTIKIFFHFSCYSWIVAKMTTNVLKIRRALPHSEN